MSEPETALGLANEYHRLLEEEAALYSTDDAMKLQKLEGCLAAIPADVVKRPAACETALRDIRDWVGSSDRHLEPARCFASISEIVHNVLRDRT